MDARELTIPDPCPADWDAMGGLDGDRARFCEHCQTRVHDLSAMRERDAAAFLAATRATGVCVSYVREPDGSVRFAPDAAPRPTPLIPVDRLRSRAGLGRAVVKTVMAGAVAACAPHGDPQALEIDDGDEAAALDAAIYDEPRIPDRAAPLDPPPVGTPCDDPAAAETASEVEAPRRTVGRRPMRKKGKLQLDRTMGFL